MMRVIALLAMALAACAPVPSPPAPAAMPPAPTATPVASPAPSATPVPSPAPSLPVPGLAHLYINGTAADLVWRVGQQARLRATPDPGQVGTPRWGTLDPERVAVTAEGLATALAPGAARLYAELNGVRDDVLGVVVAPGLPTQPEVISTSSSVPGNWCEVVRSVEDFARGQAGWRGDFYPGSPALALPAVDFTTQAVLVFAYHDGNNGEGAPLVARATAEGVVIVEPTLPHEACACIESEQVTAVTIPLAAAGAPVSLVQLQGTQPLTAGCLGGRGCL